MSVFFTLLFLLVSSFVYAEDSVRIGIPLMESNESRPYLTFNQAIRKIDALITFPMLTKYPVAATPSLITDVTNGNLYIVPDDGAEEWDGYDGYLTIYDENNLNNWDFVPAVAGMRVASPSDVGFSNLYPLLYYDGSVWEYWSVHRGESVFYSDNDYSTIMIIDRETNSIGTIQLSNASLDTKLTIGLDSDLPYLRMYDDILDPPIIYLDAATEIVKSSTFYAGVGAGVPGLIGSYVIQSGSTITVTGGIITGIE